MTEYIEREYLMDGRVGNDPVRIAAKCAPAADVEPVRHGKWLDGKCTVCGWEEPDGYSYNGYETETWEETSYCPNCGAKMDLEANK